MKKVALKFSFLALPLSLLCFEGEALAQTILLDNFESGSIREVYPNEPSSLRYLWNQYEGDFTDGSDPGVQSITTETAHDGSRSLKINVTGGNIYLQFYPSQNNTWHNMREYTQPASDWKFNTFNRMRFWIKVPKGVTKFGGGEHNFDVGTYLRRSNGDPNNAEDGGGHWYHFFNIPYTGEWHQIIVDTHPNHQRGANGGTEMGNQEYITGESGYNYFDALTRFYIDWTGKLPSYPANCYLDGFELYRETRPESIDQIYSLSGVYVPSTNEIMVGWQRNKDENYVNHEVRYAFQDIHTIGWNAATPAPSGTSLHPAGKATTEWNGPRNPSV